jgi:hypothetical protein
LANYYVNLAQDLRQIPITISGPKGRDATVCFLVVARHFFASRPVTTTAGRAGFVVFSVGRVRTGERLMTDATTTPAPELPPKPPGKRGPPPKETRPSIPLPDGDELVPVPLLADDVGMGERGYREWARDRNVRMGIFNGMSYASRNDTLAAIATDVLGAPPKRRRRR